MAMTMMSNALAIPDSPTTQPIRRNRMIPRMVRTLGVKTPAKVPKRPLPEFAAFGPEVFFMRVRDGSSYSVSGRYLRNSTSYGSTAPSNMVLVIMSKRPMYSGRTTWSSLTFITEQTEAS